MSALKEQLVQSIALQDKQQAAAPVAITETAAILSMIEAAARDPNVDIDKMERLFTMKERMEVRASETAFNVAMAAAQNELVPVARKINNAQTKSKYADLAAISEAALPIIHKHGFGLSFSECPATLPNCMGISCEVTHAGGHSKRYQYNIPMDGTGLKGNANMTQTHAYGSTFTYGRRYAECGVFNIATKNDTDGNGSAQPLDETPISDEHEDTLRKRITAKPDIHNINRFLAHLKVESLSDLLERDFKRAMTLLEGQEKTFAKKASEANQ